MGKKPWARRMLGFVIAKMTSTLLTHAPIADRSLEQASNTIDCESVDI